MPKAMLTVSEQWRRWETRSDGNLPPLIADAWYKPPYIEELDDYVAYCYDLRGKFARSTLVKVNTRTRIAALVDSFLGLHDKSNYDVVKWAREWGVLGLCGCGRPFFHSVDVFGLPNCKVSNAGASNAVKRGYAVEACDRYRDYSAQLRAAMNIVSRIQDDRPGSKKDREAIAKEMQLAGFSHQGDDRSTVSCYLSLMLRQSGVRPELLWIEGKRPEITMWNQACVIGQLVGRMAFRAAGADTITLCNRCDKPIVFDQYRKGKKGNCRTCVRREQYVTSKRRTRAAVRS